MKAKTIDQEEISFETYRGKVLLIVNVASKCGYTPQYAGLEKLYQQYQSQGLLILGFPCNQFGHQEPGSDSEIQQFCSRTYQVSFPLFSKVDVNGESAHPVFQYLKKNQKGILGTEFIKWNFTKFLIDKNGFVVDRYAPTVEPEKIAGDIEKLLVAKLA